MVPNQIFATKAAKDSFLEALVALHAVWESLEWLPSLLKEADGGKFFREIIKISDLENKISTEYYVAVENILRTTSNAAWWNEFRDYSALTAASEYLIGNGLLFIRSQAEYKFINFDTQQVPWLLGDVRSIGFAYAVLDNYCSASQANKNMWIQVGKCHAEELARYLQTYLPKGTHVENESPQDYDEVYATWKTPFQQTTEKVLQTSLSRKFRDT